MMVTDSGYRLIKLGECLVKMGQMEYSGVFNPDNINDTGYSFRDICGLAVAMEDARYDCPLKILLSPAASLLRHSDACALL